MGSTEVRRLPWAASNVRFYSAVQDRTVHFRLLRGGASEPVEQRMVYLVTDEPMPHAETRKGFAIEGGSYVMLREEELESVRPKPSRDITVSRLAKPSAVNSPFYLRPYYLGPDGAELGEAHRASSRRSRVRHERAALHASLL